MRLPLYQWLRHVDPLCSETSGTYHTWTQRTKPIRQLCRRALCLRVFYCLSPQGVLEKALSQRFQTYVPVVAAGRTDTGVHSVGQAIHFDLPNANEDLAQLTYSMNQMMPEVRDREANVVVGSLPSCTENAHPLNRYTRLFYRACSALWTTLVPVKTYWRKRRHEGPPPIPENCDFQ